MNSLRQVLVTGSNRGLGLGLIEQLAKNVPQDFHILMTARSLEKGQQSLEKIKKLYPKQSIELVELEVGNEKSHHNFIQQLESKNQKIDVLVNNAGVYGDYLEGGNILKNSKYTVDVNYHATTQFTKQMKSYITDDAKIIMIGSQFGRLEFQTEYVKKIFENQNGVTESVINDLAEQFVQPENYENPEKFKQESYHFSKLLLAQWVRFEANNFLKKDQNMFCVCPGWCQTDMGSQAAVNTIEEGVSYPFELITKFPFKRSDRSGQAYTYGKLLGW